MVKTAASIIFRDLKRFYANKKINNIFLMFHYSSQFIRIIKIIESVKSLPLNSVIQNLTNALINSFGHLKNRPSGFHGVNLSQITFKTQLELTV